MKRSLSDIPLVPSSHKVGLKRVLLAAEESGCAITQIAVTDLRAGEVAIAHIHEDMQEGFYMMSGSLDITLDGETLHCVKDDFEGSGGQDFIHTFGTIYSLKNRYPCVA